MPHSPLAGVDRAAPTSPGRDVEALGPGDSSDSGSDLSGLDDRDLADPGMPVDEAMRHAHARHPLHGGAIDGGASAPTDIATDRVFTIGEEPEGTDPDLAALADEIEALVADDPLDEEAEADGAAAGAGTAARERADRARAVADARFDEAVDARSDPDASPSR
jgi:hypothetical protein